jgi:hypothetical protein
MGRKAQEEKEETVVPQSPPRAAPYWCKDLPQGPTSKHPLPPSTTTPVTKFLAHRPLGDAYPPHINVIYSLHVNHREMVPSKSFRKAWRPLCSHKLLSHFLCSLYYCTFAQKALSSGYCKANHQPCPFHNVITTRRNWNECLVPWYLAEWHSWTRSDSLYSSKKGGGIDGLERWDFLPFLPSLLHCLTFLLTMNVFYQ